MLLKLNVAALVETSKGSKYQECSIYDQKSNDNTTVNTSELQRLYTIPLLVKKVSIPCGKPEAHLSCGKPEANNTDTLVQFSQLLYCKLMFFLFFFIKFCNYNTRNKVDKITQSILCHYLIFVQIKSITSRKRY